MPEPLANPTLTAVPGIRVGHAEVAGGTSGCTVIVAELNLGQYRREIERLTSDAQTVIGVHRVDGELITPDEILQHI